MPTSLNICLDESCSWLDRKTLRVIVCAVEQPDPIVYSSIQQLVEDLKKDKIRFQYRGKLHFNSMSEHQKALLVDKTAQLPFVARIYVHYIQSRANQPVAESMAKKKAMGLSVYNLGRLHKSETYSLKIEHADEYLGTDLEQYLDKDHLNFLLPDLVLGVFSWFLSNNDNRGASYRMYRLFKEKIRTQHFRTSSMNEYLTRGNRI